MLFHGTAYAMILYIGSPWTLDRLLAALVRLRDHGGLTILLSEQHARLALEFAARAVILDHGRIVYEGNSRPLLDDPNRLSALIDVGG